MKKTNTFVENILKLRKPILFYFCSSYSALMENKNIEKNITIFNII